jgi:hypothetical protein
MEENGQIISTQLDDEYVPLEPLHYGSSTSVTRVRHGGGERRGEERRGEGENEIQLFDGRHGSKTFIIKSDLNFLTGQKEAEKYYKEHVIGSSIHSPFVVNFVELKRYHLFFTFSSPYSPFHHSPLTTKFSWLKGFFFHCRVGYGYVLVMDDIGGVPLKTVIPKTGFGVKEFLEIACNISMTPPHFPFQETKQIHLY